MDTYTFNTTNPVELHMENWTLTAPSNPGFEFFYLATLLVGMPNSPLFPDVLSGAAGVPRPRFDGGELDDLYSFDAFPSPEALAEAQGVALGDYAGQPATDFWPEGESVEDFIEAAMEGRYEEEEDEPDS